MDFAKRPKIALAITFLLASCGIKASDAAINQGDMVSSDAMGMPLKSRGLFDDCKKAASEVIKERTKSNLLGIACGSALSSLDIKQAPLLIMSYQAYSYCKAWMNYKADFNKCYFIEQDHDQTDKAEQSAPLMKSKHSESVLYWYKKQHQAILAYGVLSGILGYTGNVITLTNDPKFIVPPIVKETFDKMDYPYDHNKIIIQKISGSVAAANVDGSISIPKNLLSLSNSIIMFVLGHEISHLTEGHSIRRFMINFVMSTLVQSGIAVTNEILENLLQRYDKQRYPYSHETLKACFTVINSPIFSFVVHKAMRSKLSRCYEKEADLAAAKKLGDVSGGIKYFEDLALKQQYAAALNPLSPLTWFFKIETSPIFRSHPSYKERIAYLTEYGKTLAQSQS